jgi:hypothetical protein
MKTVLFLITTTLLFFSCKKYQPEETELSKQLIGSWELDHVITDAGNFPFASGNGNTISFLSGSVFERKQNDTVVFRGTYSLEKKEDCFPSDKNLILKTTENPDYYQYIEVKDGKLLLSTPNCYADGGMSYYRKL